MTELEQLIGVIDEDAVGSPGEARQRVIEKIQRGELDGAEALDAWIDAQGERTLFSDHLLLPIMFALQPELARVMARKLPSDTAAQVILNRFGNGKIMADIVHVRKKTSISGGQMHVETSSQRMGSYMCRDAQQV